MVRSTSKNPVRIIRDFALPALPRYYSYRAGSWEVLHGRGCTSFWAESVRVPGCRQAALGILLLHQIITGTGTYTLDMYSYDYV